MVAPQCCIGVYRRYGRSDLHVGTGVSICTADTGRVVDSEGTIVFDKQDIEAGQQIFLKYGLMQNGSIWGHGSYLGLDFSAQYLHELSMVSGRMIAMREFGTDLSVLDASQRALVDSFRW